MEDRNGGGCLRESEAPMNSRAEVTLIITLELVGSKKNNLFHCNSFCPDMARNFYTKGVLINESIELIPSAGTYELKLLIISHSVFET